MHLWGSNTAKGKWGEKEKIVKQRSWFVLFGGICGGKGKYREDKEDNEVNKLSFFSLVSIFYFSYGKFFHNSINQTQS